MWQIAWKPFPDHYEVFMLHGGSIRDGRTTRSVAERRDLRPSDDSEKVIELTVLRTAVFQHETQ